MNKPAIVVAGVSAFVAMGCTSAGAGDEVRDVPSFTEVVLLGDYDVELRVGGGQMVVLSGASKDLALIDTEVRDGTLFVKKQRRSEPRRIDVTIDLEMLRKLVLGGSVDAELSGLGGHDFDLEMSGSVELVAEGRCADSVVEMAGSVEFEGQELVCERMDIEMSGSTDAAVHVTEEVTMQIAGSGRLEVYGNPARVIPGRLAGSVSVELK